MGSINFNPSIIFNPYPGGGNAWNTLVGDSAVSALSDNDDATYMGSTNASPCDFSYTITDTGQIPPGATNISVVGHARSSQNGGIVFPCEFSFRLGDGASLTIGSSPVFIIQNAQPPVDITWLYPTDFLVSSWSISDIYSTHFVMRGSRGDAGFIHRLHKSYLTVNWTDPTYIPPGTPYAIGTTIDSATVRIPLPSNIPASSPTCPTTLTLFYTPSPNLVAWSSIVAAVFTSGFSGSIPPGTVSNSNPGVAGAVFIDTELTNLTKGTTYYIYAQLQQLANVVTSSQATFVTTRNIQPTMSF